MFSKTKKRISRKWAIPEKHIPEFLKRYDATDDELYYDMYCLWKFVIKIIPELEKEFHTVEFNINLDCVLQPFIEEIIEEE